MEIGVILPACSTSANTAGRPGNLCDDGKCGNSPLLNWHWLIQLTKVSRALLATGNFSFFLFSSAQLILSPQQQHLSFSGQRWTLLTRTSIWNDRDKPERLPIFLCCWSLCHPRLSKPRKHWPAEACVSAGAQTLSSLPFHSQSRHPSEAWRHRNAPRPSTLFPLPLQSRSSGGPFMESNQDLRHYIALFFIRRLYLLTLCSLFFSPSLWPLCSGLCAAVEYTMRSSHSLPEGCGGAGQGLW